MRRGNISNPIDVITLADLHLDDEQKKKIIDEVESCEDYEVRKKELLQKRMKRKMKKLASVARSTAAGGDQSLELDEDEDYYVQQRGGLKPPETAVLDKICRPFALAVINSFQQSFSTKYTHTPLTTTIHVLTMLFRWAPASASELLPRVFVESNWHTNGENFDLLLIVSIAEFINNNNKKYNIR